jgi:hypothetical protein
LDLNFYEHGIKKRWWVGGLTFFLIWVLHLSAFCEEAYIKGVDVQGNNGVWKVSFLVENCFTEAMDEALKVADQEARP